MPDANGRWRLIVVEGVDESYGTQLLGMLHDEVAHLAQENERLRAELGRLDRLQRVIASTKTMTGCGPSEMSCWRASAAWLIWWNR